MTRLPRRLGVLSVAAAWSLVAVPATAQPAAASHPKAPAGFRICHTGGGYNCVVDGDTIRLRGEKIRLVDIDAPETHDFRCRNEKALGERAARRLRQLLNSGPMTVQRLGRDKDRNGRKLRLVLVHGRNVGAMLVREGLARPYGGRRRPWC